jgi:hypothetical protein
MVGVRLPVPLVAVVAVVGSKAGVKLWTKEGQTTFGAVVPVPVVTLGPFVGLGVPSSVVVDTPAGVLPMT